MLKPIFKSTNKSGGTGKDHFFVERLMTVDMQCQSQWCWAAISYSLARYHGVTAFQSQIDLARKVLLSDDIGLSSGDFANVECGRDNDGRIDKPRTKPPFARIGLSDTRRIDLNGVQESQIQEELQHGRPVPMFVQWHDTRGGLHAIVVVGGQTGHDGVTRYFIGDPYEQNSSNHTFDDLMQNYNNGARSKGRVTDVWFVGPPTINAPIVS